MGVEANLEQNSGHMAMLRASARPHLTCVSHTSVLGCCMCGRWWSVETTYAKQNGGDYEFVIEVSQSSSQA